ncbi:MAG: LysM peptidoglycan-binding domain-containing protein [Deltaproteobacteria bacterium]|nr:MAG: LysM peptidoglycan-binding domain-containing protein [Deltaproteobacteria bacterium]
MLALIPPAFAEDRISLPGGDVPVDDAPPIEPPPEADPPAIDAPDEGIWAWVARLEGEVLTPEAVEALRERVEVELAEESLSDELAAPDVPLDVYEDPTAGLDVDPLRLSEFDPARYDIPVVMNADVKKWMRYFLGNGRKHFQRYLDRSGAWLPLMEAELERAGLPRDLVYLSMIESGFNPHALSHAGAAGLWQFMPATGRMYDLRVDWWVDDRRDPVKSTTAAVAHLADLHKMFKGDWYLAWSAYNAGPGRVRRAAKSSGSTDFWTLSKGGHLPSETANYTPKILAAAIIAKDAERFGFTVQAAPPFQVDTVRVEGAISLSMLAQLAGVSVDELRSYNPGLRRAALPADGYDLHLPSGRGEAFEQALAAIPDSERVRFTRHTVARGETLGRIAQKHGVSTEELARANNLVDRNRIVVGMSLVVPRPVNEPKEASQTAARPTAHTVRAGESISSVARAYGISTADLRTWNGLGTDVIHPGQVLSLQAQAEPDPVRRDRVVHYQVQSGDTLIGIGARYGVSVAELQGWNQISDPSAIRVGQVLEVRRDAWKTYVVQRGDSLVAIARRNECTVEQLRSWNQLAGSVIHPGQELKLRR